MIGEAASDSAAPPAETPILGALATWPGSTISELADATGMPPAVVRQALRELCRRGLAWSAVTGSEAGRWRLATDGASGA